MDLCTGRLFLNKINEQEGCLKKWLSRKAVWTIWLNRKAVPEQITERLYLNRGIILNNMDFWTGRLFLNKMTEKEGSAWTKWLNRKAVPEQDGRLNRKNALPEQVDLNKMAVGSGSLCLNRRVVCEQEGCVWTELSLKFGSHCDQESLSEHARTYC